MDLSFCLCFVFLLFVYIVLSFSSWSLSPILSPRVVLIVSVIAFGLFNLPLLVEYLRTRLSLSLLYLIYYFPFYTDY